MLTAESRDFPATPYATREVATTREWNSRAAILRRHTQIAATPVRPQRPLGMGAGASQRPLVACWDYRDFEAAAESIRGRRLGFRLYGPLSDAPEFRLRVCSD